MARKRKTQRKTRVTKFKEFMQSAGNMNYKDLKRNVVVRGMDFQEVVDGSFPRLQNWLHHNGDAPIDTTLLDKFDDWVEKGLKQRGALDLIHPQLRLGYIGERDEEGKVTKRKRVKGIKKKKKKRERTKDGIYKGTKKAYVFECQAKGWSIKKTIRKTFARFPDASEKSIKIWYKKAAKLHGEKSPVKK